MSSRDLARFVALAFRALCAALLTSALSCGPPSPYLRPNVPPQPVAVVNESSSHYFGMLAVGLEPGPEISIAPDSCVLLQPPGRGVGELRLLVLDEGQATVLDLQGERLRAVWAPCTCAAGHFDRCVRLPPGR